VPCARIRISISERQNCSYLPFAIALITEAKPLPVCAASHINCRVDAARPRSHIALSLASVTRRRLDPSQAETRPENAFLMMDILALVREWFAILFLWQASADARDKTPGPVKDSGVRMIRVFRGVGSRNLPPETCAWHVIFRAQSNLSCSFWVLPRAEATEDSRFRAAASSSSLRSHLALPAQQELGHTFNSAFRRCSCPCGCGGVWFKCRWSGAQDFVPCGGNFGCEIHQSAVPTHGKAWPSILSPSTMKSWPMRQTFSCL
jgi:hypothetical protein